MLSAILTAVLLSSTPSATELVLARFTNVGLDDAHLKKARARLVSELATAEAKLVKPLTDVDEACLATPACLQGAIGPHQGALVVDILRIGPMVNITASLYGNDGAKLAAVEQTTDTTAFDDGGVFLGPDLLDPIRALAPPVVAAPTEPVIATAPAENTATTSGAGEEFPVLPVVLMAGGGVILASALAVGLLSFVAMVSQAQVLQTPTTSTDEKDLAVNVGRASLVGVSVGVLGAVVGTGLAASGFFVE